MTLSNYFGNIGLEKSGHIKKKYIYINLYINININININKYKYKYIYKYKGKHTRHEKMSQ